MSSTEAERVPLSFNQELLCMFDAGDSSGPFGPRYHTELGLRLTGPVDRGALRDALADVVSRHEPLRTKIVRDGLEHYQEVYPPTQPILQVRECPGLPPGERQQRSWELLAEMESGTISASELPLLRAVLMVFDEQDSALVLLTHHLATDGVSMWILSRDLGAFYAARVAGVAPQLPPLRPYRDFVAWERDRPGTEQVAAARKYWTDTLRGARLSALKVDHLKSAGLPPVTAMYRFTVGADVVASVVKTARSARSSPFMALLACYYRLVNQLTGLADIVVSTHTPGRGDGRFENTVGSFFNFLPLRVDLTGCQDAQTLLRRTRAACVGAYSNDIPALQVFEVAPGLMEPAMRDDLAPVTFQAFPHSKQLTGTFTDGLSYAEIRRPPESLAVGADIPDGAVWTLIVDPAGEAAGEISYRTDRFDEETIARLVEEYLSTVRATVADVGFPVVGNQ
jgi:hypothetical protein